MATPCSRVLTINGGSSSIRFALYAGHAAIWRRAWHGQIERIGASGTCLRLAATATTPAVVQRIRPGRSADAGPFLLRWLEAQPFFASLAAVGHRVVHGGRRRDPVRVTPRVLAALRRIRAYDPEHLPGEIALMAAIQRRHPRLPQLACFDTAFHRTLPRVARLLPIPRHWATAGIERYGFHGLSYGYLLEELGRLDPAAARGRVILAHLGHGASLAAVRRGRSVDTSMGFTPAAGVMMGTRSGDLDPGLMTFLTRRGRLSPAQFGHMIHREAGLRGVSGTSGDVRDLLARERRDPRAADALALFCYQVKKWIGAYAAVLGGVETLVFAGGIGENAPLLRQRICAGLGFLGIALDPRRNLRADPVISTAGGSVTVRVIRTDEELMIARLVGRWQGLRATRRLSSVGGPRTPVSG